MTSYLERCWYHIHGLVRVLVVLDQHITVHGGHYNQVTTISSADKLVQHGMWYDNKEVLKVPRKKSV